MTTIPQNHRNRPVTVVGAGTLGRRIAQENPHLPEGPRILLRRYIDDGRLGVKTGAGFYDDYPTPKQG